MRKTLAALVSLVAASTALPAVGRTPAYDAAGWRADLAQVREAFATRYANLEWAQTVREADLGAVFERADERLAAARSDAEARALFDGLSRHLADGHVRFSWPAQPTPAGPAAAPVPPSPCAEVAGRKVTIGDTALAALPGYVSLKSPASAVFPAGMLAVDGRRVGVIRIAEFTGGLAPQYCEEAVAKGAKDGLYDIVHARMTRDFADQLRALDAAGAEVLMVDVTGNGGGSDWAEALVRMVTARRLTSTRVDFIRGEHWTGNFDRDLIRLEAQLKTARGADRALLADVVAKVKARRAEAAKTCDGSSWFRGEAPACAMLARGFYSSGFLPSADPRTLAGRDWAGLVFSPMWYPYEEGVWAGPLLIAVDGRTASAAEQFTAVLQDNDAAVVVGDPTAGAGCGYTWGGVSVTLKHSGGVLRLPDCVRVRKNGENEVTGISPDVLVGYHAGDGRKARAARLAAALPVALAKAAR